MKLTLSIDKNLVQFAHRHAKASNDSISHIVSIYLDSLRQQTMTDYIPKHAGVRALYGKLKEKPPLDKKQVQEWLKRKHA